MSNLLMNLDTCHRLRICRALGQDSVLKHSPDSCHSTLISGRRNYLFEGSSSLSIAMVGGGLSGDGVLQVSNNAAVPLFYQKLPETGPAGPFGCISSHLGTTAGSALAPKAPLEFSAQAGHEHMGQLHPRSHTGHSLRPWAATVFSVPAAGSSHELHSGTAAQGFVTLWMAGTRTRAPLHSNTAAQGFVTSRMEGWRTRGQCCSSKALLAPGGTTALPSLGTATWWGGSAEVTFPLKGCICFHSESQESSYGLCGPVLKNWWLFLTSVSPRNLTVLARDTNLSHLLNPWLAFPSFKKFCSGPLTGESFLSTASWETQHCQAHRCLSTPVLQKNQTKFSLCQCNARLLNQGHSYMKHHLSHPFTAKYSKEKENEMEVCFITIIIASHLQAQKQGNWFCSKEICLLAEASSEEFCLKCKNARKLWVKKWKVFTTKTILLSWLGFLLLLLWQKLNFSEN